MMTKLFTALALSGLAVACSHGITLEEFKAKMPEEKVKFFQAKPKIEPLSDLLGLYVLSLNDPSPAMQKVAAQSAVFLVLGLQTAELEAIPAFSKRDTEALQRALCSHLTSPDDETRAAAALALVYAYPPEKSREAFFLRQIKREPNTEIQGALLEAMVQMGYSSRAVVDQALAFLESDTDEYKRATDSAFKVLAYLKPPQALAPLIALATKPSSLQDDALKVLAAYGREAKVAKSALDALLKTENLNKEIQKAAGRAFEAIVSGKAITPPVPLKPFPSVRTLWPEVLVDPR